jgi:23S rRNA (uridine2552-2'-O)-methyltransferase
VTLAERVGPEGRVVGIDLAQTDAVGPNVTVLVGDFTEPAVQDEIAAALGGPADAVLCDAAPKLTGIRDVDQGAIEELWLAALGLARRMLKPGGFMIAKGFPGQQGDLFRKELRRAFAEVHEVRPEGKRTTSKEFYWVAAGSRMRAENSGS